jgi:hypothetical protein
MEFWPVLPVLPEAAVPVLPEDVAVAPAEVL